MPPQPSQTMDVNGSPAAGGSASGGLPCLRVTGASTSSPHFRQYPVGSQSQDQMKRSLHTLHDFGTIFISASDSDMGMLISDTIRLLYPERVAGRSGICLGIFNDHPETTFADVVRVCKVAGV